MMKKSICMMFVLVVLGIFCSGMTACADETEASAYLDYKELGYTVKNPLYWEGVKGYMEIYPLSSSAILNNPVLYVSFLYYVPMTAEELYNTEDSADLNETIAALLFSIKGGRDQLRKALTALGMANQTEEELETNLVQVGEADDYQFFVLAMPDEEYAASLDEEYAGDYRNLSAVITKEMEQAEYYTPNDPMKALIGETLSFTSTDLDGNTVTSEELFQDNEITMVNIWGVWCHNCVDEMEELAAIHTRLQEKGCGVAGVEWEQYPGDETYQEARELMAEKGTNYPSVLMPEDNEIFSTVSSFPTTFFVDREGTILTDPIIGARVEEYEPALEALLESTSGAEAETEEGDGADYIYRVFVKDEEDNPVAEAIVQFCDDTSCRMGTTDENGCAVFEVPEEKSYEIHILKVPDDYEADAEAVCNTEETASDTAIVLKKKG